MAEKLCPCGTKKPYIDCCGPYHEGKEPESALLLMRSRYAAYALNIPEYLIRTTHYASPFYVNDKEHWKEELSRYASSCRFEGLEILDFKEKDDQAMVVFFADIVRFKRKAGFTERSLFERVEGKWRYRRGHTEKGRAPRMVPEGEFEMLPLAFYGDEVLRQVAKPITEITDDIKTLAKRMIYTMEIEDGMGLAAPQVHQSVRMFVIKEPHEQDDGSVKLGKIKVLINPVVSEASQEKWQAGEGCLSIPGLRGHVERAETITVEYETLDKEVVKETVSGWHAKVILHELDHINGVLYTDLVPEEEKKLLAEPLRKLETRVRNVFHRDIAE